MKKLSVILLLFFAAVNCIAQQFHFKQYSLEQGLSRSGVYHILQDSSGFLWVATEGGGLCEFDGKKFEKYARFNGLASENIRSIFQDKQGLLWLATTEGLSYYDGETFYSLTEEDGIKNNFIRSISQDNEGNIWVGSNQGISIIDAEEKGVSNKLKVNFNLLHKKVRCLQADEDIMWIGTDEGLCKYRNGTIEQVITTKDGLTDDLILTLFIDSHENLWIGTEKGLNRMSDTIIDTWTMKNGLINNRARTITEDYKGYIWIGTSKGISIYNGKGFLNLNKENGLSNDRIRCLTTDNFNNIWIGTYFGGIMRFNHHDFIAYTPKEGLVSNQILSITEDEKGDIIVGTYDGVSKLKFFNDKLVRPKRVTTQQGLSDNTVRAILKDDNGYYWYGTKKGITIEKNGRYIYLNEKIGLINSQITIIRKIKDTYWVGTEDGLATIKTEDYKSFRVDFLQKSGGLAGRSVSEIRLDNYDFVWVSFSDGSFNVFEDSSMAIIPSATEEINEITAFSIDTNNQFWIGTNGNGVFHGFYNKESHELEVENITTLDKLSSNYIFSVLVHDDLIWLGHEKGLDLLTIDKIDSTIKIQTYGLERGFFGLQNNQNASYKDSKGNLWFGTVKGLYCLENDTQQEKFNEGKPSVNYIQSVKVNGKDVDLNDADYCSGTEGVYNLPVDLMLPYNENNISFEFIGLNFISPTDIKYSWKLEGLDDDWKNESFNNNTNYTNLDPGKYTFLLQSSNEHGRITGEPVVFSFQISKPWWSTWLFRILSVILAIIIIGLIMSIRTKQLRKKQRSLENTIKERTVEITKQKEELQYKNREITDSILYSRRIQHSILPGQEKLNSILRKYFIFYKPKDIVSGDFYWAEQSLINPKVIYVAVADCTGHGVPGAMVSLVGTRALNSSVRESRIANTAEILNETNKIVLEAFTDIESGTIIKDGMDIALCSLDYSTENIEFQFSGAQNPVWIVRRTSEPNVIINGIEIQPNIETALYKLFEIKGNKQPIGYFEKHIPFVQHTGELKKGDRIYLNSDGYADQFGGPNGKKFKYKTLKKLILSIQDKNIQIQKREIEKVFYTWMGSLEQLDDVCFMAIEV